MENILIWLQNWYKSQCDGDREHTYGIKISTLDNPGWKIIIDLEDTIYEDIQLNSDLIENDDDDWYHYKIENAKFSAAGDIDKLTFLLEKFKEIISERKDK